MAPTGIQPDGEQDYRFGQNTSRIGFERAPVGFLDTTVLTNPSELALPPKATVAQAKGYSLYLLKEILGGGPPAPSIPRMWK